MSASTPPIPTNMASCRASFAAQKRRRTPIQGNKGPKSRGVSKDKPRRLRSSCTAKIPPLQRSSISHRDTELDNLCSTREENRSNPRETRKRDVKEEGSPQQVRRSTRLQATKLHQITSNDRKPERNQQAHVTTSEALLRKSQDSVQQTKNQKRPREDEVPTSRASPELSRKRARTSAGPIREPFGQEAASTISEAQRYQIDHWRKVGTWSTEDFQKSNMHRHLLARKKSSASLRCKRSEPSLITQSSSKPSDSRPREEKSAPYKHPRYELQLKERGSFMSKYEGDITVESKGLCRKLLRTLQSPPEQSLFSDDLFEKTCDMIRNRNETRVVRDIAQLIVPPAEVLAIHGAEHLKILTETVNEGWTNSIPFLGPRPQPDYALGFKREAFDRGRLQKLQPFIGELDDCSFFAATYNMYLPFLTSEVKCGASALDIVDRQNAHSMTLALRGLVELFRLVGREEELHREINGFSVSHDDEAVRIYGHYVVINEADTMFYRHPIHKFDITALDGKEKWTAYTFVRNVYDLWLPSHFERICSVVDELPPNLSFEVSQQSELQFPQQSGLSQQLEDQSLSEEAEAASRSSQSTLHRSTPNTSMTHLGQSISKKKRP